MLRKLVCHISTFFYQLGQGLHGIIRNSVMSLGSVLALVSCMIILGTFYIVLDLIEINFRAVDDMNVVEVYIAEGLNEDEVAGIGTAIEEIKNDKDFGVVESYEYLSKGDNWKRFLAMSSSEASDGSGETGIGDILNRHFSETDNPLPASYRIFFTSFSDMDKLFELRYRLSCINGVAAEDIKENFTLYEKVTNVKNAITVTGIWILIILFIVTLFIIMNTIKLGVHARRNEIVFMRYCGATKHFIRTPFIIEGIILGIVSAGVSLALQAYVYDYIIADIFSEYSIGQIADFSGYLPLLAISFAAIGLFAGIFGSALSVKKYLAA